MVVKLGYILPSDRENPLPSTRISVLNVLPMLEVAGFEAHFLFEPDEIEETPRLDGVVDRALELGIQVVYFQKVYGPSALATAKSLREHGIKTIYGVCDRIEEAMVAATDAAVVVTAFLRDLYPPELRHKICVIHDSIENPDAHVRSYRQSRGSRDDPLMAVLVTSSSLHAVPILDTPPPYLQIKVVGSYPPLPITQALRRHYYQVHAQSGLLNKARCVRDLLSPKFDKINWSLTTVYETLENADIGVIPINMIEDHVPGQRVSWWQVKSENRLTMKMALGLPVIASPVPAYEEVIVHGQNGYLAHSRKDWLRYLKDLRDPAHRKSIGEKARETVLKRFSKECQAENLIALLRSLIPSEGPRP